MPGKITAASRASRPKEKNIPEFPLSFESDFESDPEEFKTPELCLAAVQNNGHALEYVPGELKTPEFFLTAAQTNGAALKYVPEALLIAGLRLAAARDKNTALP